MDTVTAINLHSIIGALGLIDGLVIDPLVGLLISYVIIKTGGPSVNCLVPLLMVGFNGFNT